MSQAGTFKNYIRPVIILVIICLIVGGLLAVINYVTAPVIAENERIAADQTYHAVLPEADTFTELPCDVEGVTTFLKADNDAGYVVIAAARGYGGDVPAAVSFDNDGKIINVIMMDNDETPGLGQKIVNPDFYSQFNGIDAAEFTIDDIDAISGATISSKAAVKAINRAIEAYNGR